MPQRKIILATNQIYHVFNRSIGEANIFSSLREHSRFLQLIEFYRFASLNISFSHFKRLRADIKQAYIENLKKSKKYRVEVLAFCLMPNHFHLLLTQVENNGISKMLADLENSYVKFYNLRNNRAGPLFQSRFKAVRIETDEQLLHVSRYIHLNPITSYLIGPENIESFLFSSFRSYLNLDTTHDLINSSLILDLVGGAKKYRKFVLDQVDYQRELAQLKHLTLENP